MLQSRAEQDGHRGFEALKIGRQCNFIPECRGDCFLGVGRPCADEEEACEAGNWRGGRGKCFWDNWNNHKMMMMMMMRLVPIVLPWVLAPALFTVVVGAVHAWQTDSLLDALLFVSKPLITHNQLNSTPSASLS